MAVIARHQHRAPDAGKLRAAVVRWRVVARLVHRDRGAQGVHPWEVMPAGEVVGAEALHRLFREWLTELGHPSPTAAADDEKVSAAVPLP